MSKLTPEMQERIERHAALHRERGQTELADDLETLLAEHRDLKNLSIQVLDFISTVDAVLGEGSRKGRPIDAMSKDNLDWLRGKMTKLAEKVTP